MSGTPKDPNADRARLLSLQIDEVCDQFEAAWISGVKPQIEDRLGRVDGTIRSELLRELLWIELERLGRAGQQPRLASYLRRFPEADGLVREIFRHTETLAAISGQPPLSVLHDEGECDRLATTETFSAAGEGPVQPCPSSKADRREMPRKISRYRVRRPLGTGSFGCVFLAYDEVIQRLVAIKVLHAFLLSAPQAPETLLTEARCLGQLDHPAILPVFDAGRTDDGRFYVVSKYIEGTTLAARISAGRPSSAKAAELVAVIAESLHCAHRQGLIHRDVKPANILLGENDRPYIGDFGLAMKYSELGKRAGFVGTPSYMSPEQAAGQSHLVDGRSDIFSLGVILYELLTGVRPFHADSIEELLERIISLEARPPRQIDDAIPQELEQICLKAMSKRITDRYTTALDMARDLRRFLDPSRAPGPPALPGTAADGPRPAPCLDENVQFTVYRPQVIEPARWYPLLALAHLSELPPDAPEGVSDPIEEVRRQAEQSLGALVEKYRDMTQDSRSPVPREGELTFVPAVPGVEFNPRRRTFVWQEVVHREEFRLRASAQAEGRVVRGRMTVFLGAVLLAEVSMSMRVERHAALRSEESTAAVDRARRYRRIFVSCSPDDVEIVSQFERYARALGDEYYGACRALRLGAQPSVQPEELIRRSDVFQLFWSWNSIRSPAVRREWEYALSLNREGFVRPVYWETPLPADEPRGLPPKALHRLGFQQIGGKTTQAIADEDAIQKHGPGQASVAATGPIADEDSVHGTLIVGPSPSAHAPLIPPPGLSPTDREQAPPEPERKGRRRAESMGPAERRKSDWRARDEGRGAQQGRYRRAGLPGLGLIGKLLGKLTGPKRPPPERRAPAAPVTISPTPSPPCQAPPADLLDEVIEVTHHEERAHAEELIDSLAEETLRGSVVYSKNVGRTIEEAIQRLDPAVPEQREAISRLKALQEKTESGPELEQLLGQVLGVEPMQPRPAGTQRKLSRVRKPRAHLAYEVDKAGGIGLRELPLVIGVLGDFSGDSHREPPQRRPFLDVDRDNFDEVLRQIRPTLILKVEGFPTDEPNGPSVRLEFRSLEDFAPEGVVRQVQPLAAVVAERETLLREGSQVAAIEGRICRQLRAILHAPEFQRLEAAWRGLHLLVTNSETSAMLKIKVLDLSKVELAEDLAQANELDQSQLFRRVYQEPFGTPLGEPFGALLGDYEFSHQPQDVAVLRKMSQLGSIAFCPFISAASPRILGIDGWSQLGSLGDPEKIMYGAEYAQWNALRSSETARFVYLTVPRVLSRLPYDTATTLTQGFGFEEIDPGEHPGEDPAPSRVYCWTSGAYVLGMRLADSFAKAGHCLAICGPGEGRVEGLPGRAAICDDGDLDRACPTEISLTRRRVDQLSLSGLVPLLHPKDSDHAMLGSCPSIQQLAVGLPKEAAFEAILTRHLRYVMAVSRFAHYLMLIVRDQFEKSMGPAQCEESLERWVAPYVGACGPPSPELLARLPLREARIEIPQTAGAHKPREIVAWLQPWLPDLQLAGAQRITMRIPHPLP